MTFQEWKYKRLQDIGSRYEHYSDIISLWEESAEMLKRSAIRSKRDDEKITLISASIDLLRNTLDGMADYRDQQISLRRMVDMVPHFSRCEGGRGTPLNFGKSSFEEMS